MLYYVAVAGGLVGVAGFLLLAGGIITGRQPFGMSLEVVGGVVTALGGVLVGTGIGGHDQSVPKFLGFSLVGLGFLLVPAARIYDEPLFGQALIAVMLVAWVLVKYGKRTS